MRERKDLLDDRDFWDRLEIAARGWEPGSLFTGIDGFIPELMTNTGFGADVSGTVWVKAGANRRGFTCSIPQKLLDRPHLKIRIVEMAMDDSQRLHLRIGSDLSAG